MTNLFSVVLFSLIGSCLAIRCPGRDWLYRKGTQTCYYVYRGGQSDAAQGPAAETRNFNGAVQECQMRGGKIATFENAEELEYVTTKLSPSTYYYIGLTYENGKWEWYDGQTYKPYNYIAGYAIPDFSSWDTDITKLRKRVSIYARYNSDKFEFTVDTNSSARAYICKGDFSGRAWCNLDEGWSYHDGKCVKYFPNDADYLNAKLFCGTISGYIQVLNSQTEDDRYKKWLRESVRAERGWLGVTIPRKNEQTSINNVRWEDGTLINETAINNWAVKDLDNYIKSLPNGQAYCGEVFTKREYSYYDYYYYDYDDTHDWLFRNCTEKRPFACEKPKEKCPIGWREFGDNCYQLNLGIGRQRTWDQARSDCKKAAGDLLVIETETEQTFIADLLFKTHIDGSAEQPYYWIGLKGSGKDYRWFGTQQASFTAWADDQPANVNGAGCVYADGTSRWAVTGHGGWKTSLCSQKFGYICEAKNTAPIPPVEAVIPATICDPPFEKFHDGCYLAVNEKKNRDDAEGYCREKQSNLVMINSLAENAYVRSMVQNDSWIGLVMLGKEDGKWVYKYSNGNNLGSGAFKWFDSFESVLKDDTDKHCVAMAGVASDFNVSDFSVRYPKHGFWYHMPCTEERKFVCYHDGTPVEQPEEEYEDPECGPGWFRDKKQQGHYCYRRYDEPVSWRLAKQTCQNLCDHCDLLDVSTKEEHTFLSDSARNQSGGFYIPANYWTNFFTEDGRLWYWPYRDTRNKWEIPVSLMDWEDGQPVTNVLTNRQERCAAAVANAQRTPRWQSFGCETRHPFVCKKVLAVPLQPMQPPPTPAPGQVLGCPEDWYEFHGRCIQFNLATDSWSAARTKCKAMQAELLTIRSEIELQEAGRFSNGAWLGLNSLKNMYRPRVFEWSNETPFRYTPWDVQSPSSNSGGFNSNCGALTDKGLAMYPCDERRRFTCEKSLQSVATTIAPTAPPAAAGCPAGSIPWFESCLIFGAAPNTQKEYYNFDDAQRFCRTKFGGALVTINSEFEQRYIASQVVQIGAEFWIGLKQDPNIWTAFKKWENGDDVEYTRWGPEQPAFVDGDGCVGMHGAYNEGFLPGDWYVNKCTERKFALCEVRRINGVTRPTPKPTQKPPNGCPSGWTTREDVEGCYKAYIGDRDTVTAGATWQEAEDFCRRFNSGHLVSISSQAEQQYIDINVQNGFMSGRQYWIGLHQNPNDHKVWQWSDSKPITIMNFDAGNDHSTLGVQSCASMESVSGKWHTQNCLQSFGWICELPKGVYTEGTAVEQFPPAIPLNETCGQSGSEGEWFYNEQLQECHYFSLKRNTWEDAQIDCHTLGSNLVTVMNQEHHNWILRLASQHAGDDNRALYWIGLYQTDFASQEFQWIDGHSSLFRAWENGQPNPRGTERCVAHNPRSGKWRDANCAQPHNYVCAKSTRTPQRPTGPPPTGNCREGWSSYFGHCYYISNEAQNFTWAQASSFCNGFGAGTDLVSIHTLLENDFLIKELFGKGLPSNYWIGLHELQDSPDYGWSDNSRLGFLNWHENEPSTWWFQGKACVEFVTSKSGLGTWKTQKCDDLKKAICKSPKDPNAPVPPKKETKCPDGFSELNGNCFGVIELGQDSGSWANAQRACGSAINYGALATVTDMYENALIHTLLAEHWERGNNTNSGWINMKEEYGHFVWDNTCPVVFSNFQSLGSVPSTTMCIDVGMDGKWRTQDCDKQLRLAVCERRYSPCPAVHQQSEFDYCPPNFPHECNRTCYRVDTSRAHQETPRRMTYQEAEYECEKLGGHLATIRGEDDQKCLNNFIDTSVTGLWIGLYEKQVAWGLYTWQWLENSTEYGVAPSYVNWKEGYPEEPEDDFYRKSCGEVSPDGTWVNSECDFWETRGWICESAKIQRADPRKTTVLPPPYDDSGLSGGQTAGIVIGVLLAVALVGGIAYVMLTGKGSSVMSSMRSAGSRVTMPSFTNKNYAKHDDTERVDQDRDFRADSYS